MAVPNRGRGVTAVRVLLLAAGLAVGGYGALLLSENPPVIIMRILVWALVAVVVHDLVFAPLCVVLGYAGRRLIPSRWWAPVAIAALCSVVLVALSIPVYDKPGLHLDNVTVLDRDYHLGLWISLGGVWALALTYIAAAWLLPVRQDEAVDGQRTDHVEGQPPSM
jgi:hypothetical protein